MTTTTFKELAENNVRIDRSWVGKLIVADNEHRFEVYFGEEVVIGFTTHFVSGTLQGKSANGTNLIIDGEEVDMTIARPAFFGVLN